MLLLLLIATAFALLAAPASAGDAVTIQVDAAHTGATREPALEPPLKRVWQRRFVERPTYPLIVGNRVFMSVSDPERPNARVYALSARSGRTLWRRSLVDSGYAHLAYHEGRVYALDDESALFALDARSGELIWEIGSEFGINSGQPVGLDGAVYAVMHDMVRAFDAATGDELWASVINGTDSTAPAVTADRVYASFAGPQVYAFDRATGSEIWHPYNSVHGGGGATPAFYRDRLYVRASEDKIHVHASADGALLGKFPAEEYVDPAFAFNTAYVLEDVNGERVFEDGGTLVAVGLDGFRRRWRFRGDGWLQSSPLVVNRTVYVGSATGRLYALDARTGRRVWKTHLAEGVSGDGPAGEERTLAAGRGLLVVPANRRLVAFR